jgi:hypothetical protein
MFSYKRFIWLLCLALPYSASAADCEPGVEMSPQELAKHAYVRPQAASCELTQAQPRYMWKLSANPTATWPYDYAGQCTPAKGTYATYGCQAPEGCAIFIGKDKLRIHVRKGDLTCKGGMEP